jgi:hypothetical protein
LSVTVVDGLLEGLVVVLRVDRAALSVTSALDRLGADLFLFSNEDQFVEEGTVALALVPTVTDEFARMLGPSQPHRVAEFNVCVLPDSATGAQEVQIVPLAHLSRNQSPVSTTCTMRADGVPVQFVVEPRVVNGGVVVAAGPPAEGPCAGFEPDPPPPPPRVRFEVTAPAEVRPNESFDAEFYITTDAPLLGVLAALEFDASVLLGEDVRPAEVALASPNTLFLASEAAGTIGLLFFPDALHGGLPAGRHLVAALRFSVRDDSSGTFTEITFVPRVEHCIPLLPGSEPECTEAVFVNAVSQVGDEVGIPITPETVRGGILVSDLAGAQLAVRPADRFRRGDANGSDRVDLTDAIVVLGHLFLGRAAPECLDGADADDSGRLEITDALRVLHFLFAGARNLPPPGAHEAGLDPTPDALDCAAGA